MALCATQISCIHCWKERTMKSWQTCTMWGTGASSGVTGGSDPSVDHGDGDFGGWKEGPVLGQGAVWAQLKSPHCQEGGEGWWTRRERRAPWGWGGCACPAGAVPWAGNAAAPGISQGSRAGAVPAVRGEGELSSGWKAGLRERKQQSAR